MQARIIGSREDLDKIEPTRQAIVFSFRPKGEDFVTVMEKSRALKRVVLAKSLDKTMSKTTRKMLGLMGIMIEVNNDNQIKTHGRRTDTENGSLVELPE